MITLEQKKEYITHLGIKCPFCGSHDLEPISRLKGPDYISVFQTIECNRCHKKWTDEYTLTGLHDE